MSKSEMKSCGHGVTYERSKCALCGIELKEDAFENLMPSNKGSEMRPREFWIGKAKDSFDNSTAYFVPPHKDFNLDYIHVIEHSRYLAALELIERLEETLQFYAEENNYHYSNKNSAREVIDDSDIETCIINVGFTRIDVGAGGKRSREALADIKKFMEGL